MYLGNVVLVALNLPLIWLWVKLLRVPYPILAPFILVFVLVGAYSVNNSAFDLGVTVVFGVLGYAMRRLDFEPAPLVLAMSHSARRRARRGGATRAVAPWRMIRASAAADDRRSSASSALAHLQRTGRTPPVGSGVCPRSGRSSATARV